MSTPHEIAPATEIRDGKPHPGRRMTEAEFVAWADDKTRAEWIDGEVIVMSPSSNRHSWISGLISSILRIFVEERELGEVHAGQFTTRLTLDESIQRRDPDVMFIAKDRLHLVKENHLEGPPDVAFEVVSPDSVARDWREKYQDYESAGVREYWVIDPLADRVEAYGLGEDGKYTRLPETDGTIRSGVLAGFFLKTAWLFGEEHPKTRAVLAELGIE